MTERTTACPDFERKICLMCPFLRRENVKIKLSCDKVKYSMYMNEIMLPNKCRKTLKEIQELCKVNGYQNVKVIASLLLGIPV